MAMAGKSASLKEKGRKAKALKESPSQTAGPYVHIGLTPGFTGIRKVFPHDLGKSIRQSGPDAITISGSVYDGAGEAVRDCLIEFTQADTEGKLNPARASDLKTFSGFNRVPVNLKTGKFILHTLKPGQVAGPNGVAQAPHITLWIVARGINIGLHTRLYFDDEAEANALDPVLALVRKKRRQTLLAKATGKASYQFDIRLQGENETVFFDA